jgi:hypothetical protein
VLSVEKMGVRCRPGIRHEVELALATLGKRFYEQLTLLEPFGEGNRAPVFLARSAEVLSVKDRWVRVRQGRSNIEVLSWNISLDQGMEGDCLIEFHGKTRVLRGFAPHKI